MYILRNILQVYFFGIAEFMKQIHVFSCIYIYVYVQPSNLDQVDHRLATRDPIWHGEPVMIAAVMCES